MSDSGSQPFVVVGVDGSPNSKAALRWALREAELRRCELHVVSAYGHQLPGFGFTGVTNDELAREQRDLLEAAIAELGEDRPPVAIVLRVVDGHPTPVLVDASKGAELLVVGDRGYGGFAGLLLGSIGEQCVRRASCSVVVVRGRR